MYRETLICVFKCSLEYQIPGGSEKSLPLNSHSRHPTPAVLALLPGPYVNLQMTFVAHCHFCYHYFRYGVVSYS